MNDSDFYVTNTNEHFVAITIPNGERKERNETYIETGRQPLEDMWSTSAVWRNVLDLLF